MEGKREKRRREGGGKEKVRRGWGRLKELAIVPHNLKTEHSGDIMVVRPVTHVDAVTYYFVVPINTEETISLLRQLHN